MRLRFRFAIGVLCAVLTTAVLLGGCVGKAPSPGGPVSPAPLSPMSADDKFSQIATSFPPMVPVPAGTIVSGQAQGDTAWDYTVVVPGSPESVKEWYRVAYGRAEWTVVAETPDSLSLAKNAAQSHATFAVDQPGVSTRVTVTLGTGTPVLQLQ